MKAARFEGIDRIVYGDVPEPEMDDDSILIKVHACAICGSDIRILHSGNDRVQYPQIPGHEFSGDVVAVGANVTKFQKGDRVAVGADVPCGECEYCEAGHGNNCMINYAIGYQFPGGFAQYVKLNRTVVDHGPVHKLPDHVTYDEAALAEPLGCILNALFLTRVELNDTAVIIGAGPLGIMMIQVLRRMGAGKIIMVQRSRPRLELAKNFGADVYICSSEEDAISRVKEETHGQGAQIVITANPSASTHRDALEMAANRGRVMLFGGLPKGSEVTLDTNLIHYKELSVIGAHGATPDHHRQAVNMIAGGLIDMNRYITGKFPLSEVEEAFKVSEGHEGLRVILHPWEGLE